MREKFSEVKFEQGHTVIFWANEKGRQVTVLAFGTSLEVDKTAPCVTLNVAGGRASIPTEEGPILAPTSEAIKIAKWLGFNVALGGGFFVGARCIYRTDNDD